MIKVAILLLFALPADCFDYYEEGRIVGGQNLTEDDIYPFMVSVRYLSYDFDDFHYCGGVIVSKRTVLTAAQCLNDIFYWNIAVIAGTNYWNETASRYRVQNAIVHPDLNVTELSNDVGLVIVNRQFFYTSTIQPIQLSLDEIVGGETGYYLGWGLTTDNGTLSDVLKYLHATTITNSECAERMGEVGGYIFDTSLCTMSQFGESVCNGDSGTPLINNNKLIGMASWVYGKCGEGYPDVSVRIGFYIDWIQSNLVD